MQEIARKNSLRNRARAGEDDADDHQQRNLHPPSPQLRRVKQTEKNSGGEDAGRHTPAACNDRVDVAAKNGLLDHRRDKHSHQQQKNRRAAILEQLLHRHLRIATERNGGNLNRHSEQESAQQEAQVPQGARQLAGLQRAPADRAPERRAKAHANVRCQKQQQNNRQQRLMHDGEQPRITGRRTKLGGLDSERSKYRGERKADQKAAGRRKNGEYEQI